MKKKKNQKIWIRIKNIIHNHLFKIDYNIMNIWYRKTVINQFQANNKFFKKLSNNDNFCEHIFSSVDKNIEALKKRLKNIIIKIYIYLE